MTAIAVLLAVPLMAASLSLWHLSPRTWHAVSLAAMATTAAAAIGAASSVRTRSVRMPQCLQDR